MTAPTHELRDCWRCDRGRVYRPPTVHGGRGEWVPCPTCSGSGRTLVYVYVMQHQRRGRA